MIYFQTVDKEENEEDFNNIEVGDVVEILYQDKLHNHDGSVVKTARYNKGLVTGRIVTEGEFSEKVLIIDGKRYNLSDILHFIEVIGIAY